MAMPRRTDVDDYLARLTDAQRPHLGRLRELSLAVAPEATETLKWNSPAYVQPDILWMLQAFKNHCAVRFPPHYFAERRDEVVAAGYEGIEGAIKIRYDQTVPDELVTSLMAGRLEQYLATGAKWAL